MTKPFKTHEEQIDLLLRRGLIIPCEERTKAYLFLNNYYNVANRYGEIFKERGKEIYKTGTSFDHLVAVNIYDRGLKGSFYSKILEMENNLKSVISYVFSKNYQDQYSYLDCKNYHPSKLFESTTFSSQMVRIIDRYKTRTGNAIYHYNKEHKHIPLWVLVNFMSFGNISFLYKIMAESDQTEVAKFFSDNLNKEYGRTDIRIDPGAFVNYLDALNEFRNAAAHDECMITFTNRTSVIYNEVIHKLFSVSKESPRQNLFNMLVIMRIFLNENQFKHLYNSTIKRSKEVGKGISVDAYEKVCRLCGFQEDWGSSPKYHKLEFTAKMGE